MSEKTLPPNWESERGFSFESFSFALLSPAVSSAALIWLEWRAYKPKLISFHSSRAPKRSPIYRKMRPLNRPGRIDSQIYNGERSGCRFKDYFVWRRCSFTSVPGFRIDFVCGKEKFVEYLPSFSSLNQKRNSRFSAGFFFR